jgi:hypothetical protein
MDMDVGAGWVSSHVLRHLFQAGSVDLQSGHGCS